MASTPRAASSCRRRSGFGSTAHVRAPSLLPNQSILHSASSVVRHSAARSEAPRLCYRVPWRSERLRGEQFFQVFVSCPWARVGSSHRRSAVVRPLGSRPGRGRNTAIWFGSSCWTARTKTRPPRSHVGYAKAGLSRDECGFRVWSNAWPCPRASRPHANPCEPMQPMQPVQPT
jgi:hypothetical protein